MTDRFKPYSSCDELPGILPLFSLPGVLLLPRGQLPLNVFEGRYLDMVDDAFKTDRLIGLVQPKAVHKEPVENTAELFETGCAGRITDFSETDDGRYLITLSGVCRFRLADELPLDKKYRRTSVLWSDFEKDLKPESCLDLDRARLKILLRHYFDMHDISCDTDMIDGAPDEKLITCLSMICPLEHGEKQALLEATCCRTRAEMFMAMLEMAVRSDDVGCDRQCH